METTPTGEFLIRMLLDHTTNYISVRDSAGNFTLANRRLEELYGLPASSLTGKNIRDVLCSDDAHRILRQEHEVLSSGHELDFFEIQTLQGVKREFMVSRFPIFDAAGVPVSVCSVATDLTPWKRLEKERARAESINLRKDHFLASISHDIRTPLSGIVALTNILLEMGIPGEVKDYLTMMKDTADSLVSLLTQILDYSKIESRRMELSSLPFDLRSLLSSLVTVFGAQAEEKTIGLTMSVAPDVPKSVEGDPERLKQVLSNLISNAVKFTSRGEVGVSVRVSGSFGDSIILEFSVRDSGIGIPKEKLKSIFQSFSQLESPEPSTNRGVGLGLAIARRIVAMMNGKITVESTPGVGSVFSFTARFRKEAVFPELDDGREDAAASGVPAYGGEPRNLRILVAEDDRINSLYVCRILSNAGHEVTAVTNGCDVLEALAHERFDLILMDGRMPLMDGLETTRMIRTGEAENPSRSIPIIAFTAYSSEEDRNRFLDAGMNDYLCKPVDEAELRAKIARLCRRQAECRPSAEIPT